VGDDKMKEIVEMEKRKKIYFKRIIKKVII
jgi:hypothetical protein